MVWNKSEIVKELRKVTTDRMKLMKRHLEIQMRWVGMRLIRMELIKWIENWFQRYPMHAEISSQRSIFTGRQRYSCKPCTSYDRDVCPSVRPSVTPWHSVKTRRTRIAKSSPTDSPRTLVFGIKNSSRNSKAVTPNEGVVGKIRNLQPITRRISEKVQDRIKVTINH